MTYYSTSIDTPTRSKQMNTFQVNQIVAGKFGKFVILAFRTLPGETEQYAQVKPYNPATGKTGRGEMALPVSSLKAAQ